MNIIQKSEYSNQGVILIELIVVTEVIDILSEIVSSSFLNLSTTEQIKTTRIYWPISFYNAEHSTVRISNTANICAVINRTSVSNLLQSSLTSCYSIKPFFDGINVIITSTLKGYHSQSPYFSQKVYDKNDFL